MRGAKESLGYNDDLTNCYGGVYDNSQELKLRAHKWV